MLKLDCVLSFFILKNIYMYYFKNLDFVPTGQLVTLDHKMYIPLQTQSARNYPKLDMICVSVLALIN